MNEPDSSAVVIRDASVEDVAWMLPLNNAAAPAVNELTEGDLRTLLEWARFCLVARIDAGARGFVLALPGPGLGYASDNYRYFSERFDRFLYVDRVVVEEGGRGAGLGGSLYRRLTSRARGGWPRICAEVNLRPPNPRSLVFHERRGFGRIGEQDTEGGRKRVALLEKLLENPEDA